MNKFLKSAAILVLLLTSIACNNDTPPEASENLRPHDPWVFRSVLDLKPRMITLALHEDLWAAYSTEHASLYKVWKGNVDFDGAVYTTAHGPQPVSIGDAYVVNEFEKPWMVQENGKELTPEINYRGHRFVDDHAELMYELKWNGKSAKIYEQPEHTTAPDGSTGFVRTFTTADVPEGTQIILRTNISSVPLKSNVKTDGTFNIEEENLQEAKDIKAFNLKGKLVLNSNASTTFTAFFAKKPMIENPNKGQFGEDEDESTPLGYRLIAKSDCKTCHNTNRKTIGPAYVDIAKKYSTTEENIAMLVNKVKYGGYGVWGAAVMSAHPSDSESDLRIMVEYILSLDADEEAQLESMPESEAPEDADYVYAEENVSEPDMLPGVVGKVYFHEKDLKSLADVNREQAPTFVGVFSQIHAQDADLKDLPDNFAIIGEGYLNIRKSGNYNFRLISDDGSRLTIGEKVVIDHDGLHGADARDGSIALKEGFHPFVAEYFQGKGGKNISLQWQVGGGEFVPIPSVAYVHHKKDAPENTVSNPLAKGTKIPGDGAALAGVHPSYDLSQARPATFTPRVGGIDFLSDGRMVLSTWDAAGSIFLLDGVQTGDPAKMTTKTIAKGFAEPLGLKVVDDEIYVLQKQELTKLVDTDGDDVADEYLTVCNDWRVSANFHEFAFGLVYKNGYFYATLATAINPGGASTQPQIPDRGKVVKISKADGSLEFIASGLRTPNGIGIGVDNEIFVADNQGDWLPASKIVHIKPGGFYGSRSVDFAGTEGLKEDLPVVWLPQDEIGNSPSTPTYLNDGPYKNQMIHGEVTHGGIKRVFVEKINGAYQGCLFRFTQGLEAGVNRIVWGPDGALYVGGIGSSGNWQHADKLWYGLQRLKYNEKSTFEMLAVRAKSNGVEIEFTEALQPGDGWNNSDYLVQQWYYKPTKEYGGPKLDLKNLTIKSVNVSDDRKKVFLELDGMQENHVVYIKLQKPFISSNNNELWSTEAWYTMNQIPSGQPGFKTTAPQATPVNTLSEAEKAAGWKLLFDGKSLDGWRNFKKQTIGSGWIIEDNAIHLDARKKAGGGWQAENGGDIITEGQYENYELNLEWKIGACGNSGIIFNVNEDEKYDYVWQTGPEMQVLDNTCHPDAKIETHRAGDLYDMIACKYETVKPAGQWNQVRLIVNNGKTEHWLNGRKVVEYEMFTDQWAEMIANSKFKDMPDFGKTRKGHISLQDHGDPVWFRNIKIKEL